MLRGDVAHINENRIKYRMEYILPTHSHSYFKISISQFFINYFSEIEIYKKLIFLFEHAL